MKKAFSLIELVIVITLLGVMTILSVNYLNVDTLSQQNTKTQFQSHLNIITASILQCKELSNVMPIDGGAFASDTLLNTLDCNTSIPYSLNGERGSFIPNPLTGFTVYKATQVGSEFYFTTSSINSNAYAVLKELENEFSPRQYELNDNGTTADLKFYLSR